VPPGTFVAIDGGWNHFLAIRKDGTAVGWGLNFDGQATPPPGQFLQVAAAKEFSVGLRPDHSVVQWGHIWSSAIPTGPVLKIASGYEFSAALLANGTVYAWGNSFGGCLNVPSGTYIDITCAGEWGAALRADGQVVFWGNSAPPQGNLGGSIARIDANRAFVVGLRFDGTLAGTVGLPQILPPGTFAAIGAGGFHGLAVLPPCYANCDGSTLPPRLTANDFQCFLDKFASGDASSNCDGSSVWPVLTANDFQCFLNSFAAGCS
jgi:hypothetical protein